MLAVTLEDDFGSTRRIRTNADMAGRTHSEVLGECIAQVLVAYGSPRIDHVLAVALLDIPNYDDSWAFCGIPKVDVASEALHRAAQMFRDAWNEWDVDFEKLAQGEAQEARVAGAPNRGDHHA